MRSISSNVSFKTCVSLLIICFNEFFIGVSGVLKYPTINMLLSTSHFMSVSICLMYRGAFMFRASIFTIVMFFLLGWPLDYFIVSFLIPYINIYFKVCFFWYENCYSCFLLLSIYMKYIFSILSLPVFMCLEVWSGFLVDSIYMGLVFVSIQPVCVFWLEYLIHFHLK